MSENSNSDSIALRREARRRKILENAESRLRTITGKGSSASHNGPNPINIFHSLHNDLDHENSFDDINQEFSVEKNLFKDLSGLNESFQYNSNDEVKIKTPSRINKSYLELIIQKRLHYIILSLVIHSLLFFKLGFTFYNNVFCPFITVKLMEFIFVQSTVESTQSNIISLIVPYLSKGHVVTFVFRTYSIIVNIFSDFFLYMFFFILNDKLFHIINELYIR